MESDTYRDTGLPLNAHCNLAVSALDLGSFVRFFNKKSKSKKAKHPPNTP